MPSPGPSRRAELHDTAPSRRAELRDLPKGLSTYHISPRRDWQTWKVTAYTEGGLIEVHSTGLLGGEGQPGKRGVVKRFSEGSRRRLMRNLARTKVEEVPIMVTLTYPDDFPGNPREWKADLDRFQKRLVREHPKACGFWKLELKRRQSGVESVGKVAPHFHLLIWGVPWTWQDPKNGQLHWEFFLAKDHGLRNGMRWWKEVSLVDGKETKMRDLTARAPKAGETVKEFRSAWTNRKGESVVKIAYWVIDGKDHIKDRTKNFTVGCGEVQLREWLSITWAAVVGSDDPRHLVAGTNAVKVRSRKGVMYYASKYVCKSDSESIDGQGRFWGIFNRTKIPWSEVVDLSLDGDEARRLVRIARHYVDAQMRSQGKSRRLKIRRGCGLTFFCTDPPWWLARMNALVS